MTGLARVIGAATPLFLFLVGAVHGLAAQAPAPSPERAALAAELLEVLRVDSLKTEEIMRQFRDAPEPAAAVGDSVAAFFERHLSWELIEDAYVAAYAERFTADELRGLIDWFQTPLGRSWMLGSAELRWATQEIDGEALRPHVMELQQMMMRAASAASGSGSPSGECRPPLC